MSDHLFRRVGLCLPPALHNELTAAAARAGLPVSTYARLVIANQLGQIPAKVAA